MAYACTFLIGVALGKLQAGLALTTRQRTLVAAASLIALAAFYARAVSRMAIHPDAWRSADSSLCRADDRPERTEPHRLNIHLAAAGAARPGQLLPLSVALQLHQYDFVLYHVTERLHLAALDPWITYAATILLAFAALYLVEDPARNAILQRGTAHSA